MSDPSDPSNDAPDSVRALADGVGTDAARPSVLDIEIREEMEQSFLDYAMSVITARALPDARDGLKPVHRRILWSMFDTGLRPNRPHKKCATVVGDVIANYHPHGDGAIYDALVRMGQHFSLANTLIDPHGNFGSPSDPPAAYRYTECRLTEIAMSMTEGIDEETVDFAANFDGSRTEPLVLPSRFPNLLVNGSQGIAVGMATNIPTHNLAEVIDATIHLIEHPDATVNDLLAHVQGPDFPTGGIIMGRHGAVTALKTGRGSVRIRARAEIVERGSKTQIVVTEIPYQTSLEGIESKIAEAVNRKVIDGIAALRNESARGTTRFVIDLKPGASANVVLNNLWRHTPLQSSFAVNMVALDDGVPRTLNLRDALVSYADHQIEVVTRRSEHRLSVARAREHIVVGLLRALDLIDEIIALIRASEDRAEALAGLGRPPLSFSAEQANHILDMQLARLTRLGRARLTEELAELRAVIAELEAVLDDDAKLRAVIVSELTAIRDAHGAPRRTAIEFDPGEVQIEDLIDDELLVLTVTRGGYAKSMPPAEFRLQGRGGRGVRGTGLKDDDYVIKVLATTAHATLLFFTDRGRVHQLKAYVLPQMSRAARGTALVNYLRLEPGESVEAVIDASQLDDDAYLLFVTRRGMVKRTPVSAYANIRSSGLIALRLNPDDQLVRVVPTPGDGDVLIASRRGRVARFAESAARPQGRAAAGVRGIRLRDDDEVAAADVAAAADERDLLLVNAGGLAKRTPLAEFPRKGRHTGGVIGMRFRGADEVRCAQFVESADELLVVSSAGALIRTRVSDISVMGRNAGGVRTMSLGPQESVVAIAPVDVDETDDDVGHADEHLTAGQPGDTDTPSDPAQSDPAQSDPDVDTDRDNGADGDGADAAAARSSVGAAADTAPDPDADG